MPDDGDLAERDREGAFEAAFPAGRCARAGAPGLYARRCDGLEVEVLAGDGAGDDDRLAVRVVRAEP